MQLKYRLPERRLQFALWSGKGANLRGFELDGVIDHEDSIRPARDDQSTAHDGRVCRSASKTRDVKYSAGRIQRISLSAPDDQQPRRNLMVLRLTPTAAWGPSARYRHLDGDCADIYNCII